MKKLTLLMALVLLVTVLASCGVVSCKESGCDDEVYENGYCKYHYTINAVKGEVDDAGKGLFDDIFGS